MKLYSPKYNEFLNNAIEVNELYDLKGKRILVTGATGLIGSTIIDMLVNLNASFDSKIKIFAAVRNVDKAKKLFNSFMCYDYFDVVTYDATKEFTFEQDLDYIIHAASNANPQLYVAQPVETLLGNVFGIKNILEYAKVHNVENIIYVSSSEVYGSDDNRNKMISEDDYVGINPLITRASYMTGKRASENLCVGFLKEYGVNSVVVRPGHIYGPHVSKGDNRAASDFLRLATKHEEIEMRSAGRQLRSYCHAVDCASAILLLALRGRQGEAYNVSNKNSIVTIKQFAESVAEIGKVNLNLGVGDTAAMSYSALNAQKLEELGWKAVVNLKEGIEEAILDFQSY